MNVEFQKTKAGLGLSANEGATVVETVKCAKISQKLKVQGGYAENYADFARVLIAKGDPGGMLIFGRKIEPIFDLKNMMLTRLFRNVFCRDGPQATEFDCTSIDAKLGALQQAYYRICEVYEVEKACTLPQQPTPAPLPPPDQTGQWVPGHEHRFLLNIVVHDRNIKKCTAKYIWPHGIHMRGAPRKECPRSFGSDMSNPNQNCIFQATGVWREALNELWMAHGINVKVDVDCELQNGKSMNVEIFYDNGNGRRDDGDVTFTTTTTFDGAPKVLGTKERHTVRVAGGYVHRCPDFCYIDLFLSSTQECV